MKDILKYLRIVTILLLGVSPKFMEAKTTDLNYITVSQDFLYAVRTESFVEADSLANIIASADMTVLISQLGTDAKKKAFWLNIYNAYVQFYLSKDAALYKSRGSFFGKKQVPVAGIKLSLDQVEHDILRKSMVKLSYGYLPKWFVGTAMKKLRVETRDYRIHFALNCGASSCPPIAYYDDKEIDQQLNVAENFFIPATTTVDDANQVIKTTRILSWFRGDFGGKNGIRKLLGKHGFPQADTYKVVFEEYNWNLELKKYSN